MEVFTGDRCMPTGVVLYPDNLTHFPTTPSDDLNSPPGIFTQPQKLRPIRCHGNGSRTSADFSSSDPTTGGLDGSLINYYGPTVEELGFFTHHSSAAAEKQSEGECSGGGRDYLGSCAALPEKKLGVSVENSFSLVGVECKKILAQAQAELRSLSDGDEETPEAIKKSSKRKRKRRTREKLQSFVQTMITSVMQKQEEMHRQMIEILEKKEKERLVREEAWKQQEMERAKREREERAEETSRSLALISFIQKLMGHEIQIPIPLEIPFREKEEGEVPNQDDITCGPTNNEEKLTLMCLPGNNQEDLDRDPSNRRWPKSEVQALITVRAALTQKFNSKGPKNSIWEEVALGMSNLGYCRTSKKCKEKWDNINKYYKRLMENGSTKRSDNSKVCQYFNELDLLYKSGFIGSGNHDFTKKVIEEQSAVEE